MSSYQDVKVLSVAGDSISLRVTEMHPDSVALSWLRTATSSPEDRWKAATFGGWLLRDAPPFNRNAFATWVATSSLVYFPTGIVRAVSLANPTVVDHSATHDVEMLGADVTLRVENSRMLEGLKKGMGWSAAASLYTPWSAIDYGATTSKPGPRKITADELARAAKNLVTLVEREKLTTPAALAACGPSAFFDMPPEAAERSHEFVFLRATKEVVLAYVREVVDRSAAGGGETAEKSFAWSFDNSLVPIQIISIAVRKAGATVKVLSDASIDGFRATTKVRGFGRYQWRKVDSYTDALALVRSLAAPSAAKKPAVKKPAVKKPAAKKPAVKRAAKRR
ncbi:MAG TPA: hypothetical protein VGM90_08605 [Kofleriaceae bacterium]|jgi:hypothetical protein